MVTEEMLERAKRDYPIGCRYRTASGQTTETLIKDSCTYKIAGNLKDKIWAHEGGGCLFDNASGGWAQIISLPKGYNKHKLIKIW